MDSAAAAHSAGGMAHELDFASALQAAGAIRTKKISSAELTRHVFERIDRYNPAHQRIRLSAARMKRSRKRRKPTRHWQSARRLARFPWRSDTREGKLCRGGQPSTWGIRGVQGREGFAKFGRGRAIAGRGRGADRRDECSAESCTTGRATTRSMEPRTIPGI